MGYPVREGCPLEVVEDGESEIGEHGFRGRWPVVGRYVAGEHSAERILVLPSLQIRPNWPLRDWQDPRSPA